MESLRNNATSSGQVTSTEIFLRGMETDRALYDRLTERMDTLPSGCIRWRGSITREPRMWIHGRPVSVRRLLWETSQGPLPAGKRIREYCGKDTRKRRSPTVSFAVSRTTAIPFFEHGFPVFYTPVVKTGVYVSRIWKLGGCSK